MKLTIEIETDDLNILKLIAKAAYVKPAPSNDVKTGGVMNGRQLTREVSRLRSVK